MRHGKSGVVAQSPCILGGCEHIFCHICIEKFLGKSCPHCHIPAHVKDADVNRQLFNIASLCETLRKVLTSTLDDNTQNKPDGEVFSEDAECTPKQPVKDVYHFDTPTEEKMTKQELEQQNDSLKNPDRKSKKKTNRNRKSEISMCGKTEKARKKVDEKLKESTGKKQKKLAYTETRKKVPSDQSTMTQFYDYDNDDGENSDNTGLKDKTEMSRSLADLHPDSSTETAESTVELKEKHATLKGTNLSKSHKAIKPSEKKKNKAAAVITELCKTTTRLRQKNILEKNLPSEREAERTSWFVAPSSTDTETSTVSNKTRKKKNSVEKKPEVPPTSSEMQLESSTNGEAKSKVSKAKSLSNDVMEKTEPVSIWRPRTKRSRSPSLPVKLDHQDPSTPKTETEKSESVTKKTRKIQKNTEASPSTPTQRAKSRLSSVKKTPRNKEKQGKANFTPTSSPMSTGKKSTPQRLKDINTPPALSPALNKRNAKGETPLQVAAIKNDVAKVADLLRAGANPNVRDNAGWTPLHEACNHGYTEVAKLLLDNGAMVSVPGHENDTPLHDAVSNGRIECAKLLVSRGASPSVRNLKGLTPEDLATTDLMRDALKTAVQQVTASESQMPLDTLEYQQPCLMGTSLSRDQKIVLQKCASLLSAKLTEECTPEVTHVITSCNTEGRCARTIKYLQAVLTGKWILSMDWVNTCLELGSKVCEEAFEVQGTSVNPDSKAPFKGRINRKQQLPGLFDGCQFYFHGNFEFSMPTKDDLLEVIRSGGGKILSREPKPGHLDSIDLTVPYHSGSEGNHADCCIFVVHENSAKYQPVRTKHMCSVPVSWIMDSAAEFKLKAIPEV